MVHAICDFCGKDCQRTAMLLVMTPFQNFARYHCDVTPYGSPQRSASFVICSECSDKHGLPNPYMDYEIDKPHYDTTLDSHEGGQHNARKDD